MQGSKCLDEGFVLLPRSSDGLAVMDMPPHFREIWIYLLKKAQQTKTEVDGTILQRGQCLVNCESVLHDLSWMQGFKRVSYTRSQYKNAMSALARAGVITRDIFRSSGTRGTLVTVIGYDFLQQTENYQGVFVTEPSSGKDKPSIDVKVAESLTKRQDRETKANSDKPAKKRKKAAPREIPPDCLALSEEYLRKHMEIYPNLTKSVEKSKVRAGAAALADLVRLDKYDLEQIRKAVFWALRDSFWGPRLMSLGSLRGKSRNGHIKFKNLLGAMEEARGRRSASVTAQYRPQQDKDFGSADAGFLGN